jgi:3'(2'), 5'-bisphosphate nucleotidase
MRGDDTGFAPLIDVLVATAVAAGAAIMDVYAVPCTVAYKADNSPVTEADARAEAIILADLASHASAIPVIAEEEVAAGRIPDVGERFFLVDPLDGTREFIDRNGDFTVNIALVDRSGPVFGIVFAPARGTIWVGDVARQTAWTARVEGGLVGTRRPIGIRQVPAVGLSVVASRSHATPETDAYLAQFAVAERVAYGSSLKLCMVAGGEADLYPRLGPTHEWDIAAGDAVLRASGGMVFDTGGAPMTYGKPQFYNGGFVAAGDVVPPPLAPFMLKS